MDFAAFLVPASRYGTGLNPISSRLAGDQTCESHGRVTGLDDDGHFQMAGHKTGPGRKQDAGSAASRISPVLRLPPCDELRRRCRVRQNGPDELWLGRTQIELGPPGKNGD